MQVADLRAITNVKELPRGYIRSSNLLAIVTPVAISLLIVSSLCFMVTTAPWLRLLAILVLAWWLPGVLLVFLWQLPDVDSLTATLLAAGLGVCWMILIALSVHWMPGRIDVWQLVAVYDMGALILLALLWWRRSPPSAPSRTPAAVWLSVLFLIVLAAVLWLPGLGGYEFFHDETSVLVRARDALRGADDALERHPKGPGEIAITLVIYAALNTLDESTARFPFVLMGLAGIITTAQIGRWLFSPRAAFWAGVLLIANGYLLALTRIVQYQAAIILFMALAFLAAWRFAQGSNRSWLALVVVFSAFGTIMHYEYVLTAPVLLWLVALGWRRTGWDQKTLRALLPITAICALLVGYIYWSMFSSSYFAQSTRYYYAARLGDVGNNNLPLFLDTSTLYNSIYFFVGLMVLVAIGLAIAWRSQRANAIYLVLWFAPSMVLNLFVVQYPGTHFYTIMPGLSLLAALPLAAIVPPEGASWSFGRAGLLAMVLMWLGLSFGYLYLVFVRVAPAYLLNFESMRQPLYWTPYGSEFAQKARIGLPIYEGWKTLGVLREWGFLTGTYASNERHTRWYMGDFDRVDFTENPDFIFVASNTQMPNADYDSDILDTYHRIGEVRVRGEPAIALFAGEPIAAPYLIYDAESFEAAFGTQVAVLEEWPDPSAVVQNEPISEEVTLESAGVEQTTLRRGETLHLLLNWRPHEPLDRSYKLFVHLGADANGRPLAQWDGWPGLNTWPTDRWPANKTFKDHVLLTIPRDMPTGEHQVLVGLYDESTGERLGGRAVAIATITVN